jgi:hypothetical protein
MNEVGGRGRGFFESAIFKCLNVLVGLDSEIRVSAHHISVVANTGFPWKCSKFPTTTVFKNPFKGQN